jgi:hypothetical protein
VLSSQLHKVAAADARNVWAVGGIGSNGPVYHFDGRSWGLQYDAHESLFDVTTSDKLRAWAVGGLGGIFIYENTPL